MQGAEIKHYCGFLYLAAGQSLSASNQFPNGFFRYNLDESRWEDITNPLHSYTSRFYSGSVLIHGYFYLVYGWSYSINNDIADIVRVNLNSTDFSWEGFPSLRSCVRDSFSIASSDADIYIFGGYIASTSGTVNDLIRLDTSTGEFTTLTPNKIYPSARTGPSMSMISATAVLFGGMGLDSFYSDMWVYSFAGDTWTSVMQLGSVPGARYLHAADSQGNAIAIWGGKGQSGLLDDFYIFNSLNNYWTMIEPIGTQVPAAAVGACVVMDMPLFYIYGGNWGTMCSGQLWTYDLGTNEYTLLSSNGPQLAYITCALEGNYFYVMFGETFDEVSSNSISRFNFKTLYWDYFYSNSSSFSTSSRGLQLMLDGIVIRIGGESWGTLPMNQVFVFNRTQSTLVGTIPEIVYLSGYVYYNTSLYSFGGSTSMGSGVPSNLFLQIDLLDICSPSLCTAQCSPGTFQSLASCAISDKGHYSEGFGNTAVVPCPAGTFNSEKGASSSRQCYPCPDSYFNAELGAYYCLQCPAEYSCPIGTIEPVSDLTIIYGGSIQPGLYTPADPRQISMEFEVVAVIGMLALIGVSVAWERVRERLRDIDYYSDLHNYPWEKFMKIEKKTIGGLFTLIAGTLSLLVVGASIITYTMDNIQETKALVPLVILQLEVTDFVATEITILTSFLRYGDSCVVDGACSKLISVVLSNVRYSSYQCTCNMSSDKTCEVSLVCKGCIIDTGGLLQIVMKEKLSYATGIYVNVTSASSIPNSLSSVLQTLYPEPGYMLIGSVASEFYFTMTPSLFKSEASYWPSMATGYHVAAEQRTLVGSEYGNTQLPIIASQLKLSIFLDKSISALYTARILKQDVIFVFSSLIGSVFGIMGGVGGLMHFLEGSVISKIKYITGKRNVRKLKEKRIILKAATCERNMENEELERNIYTKHSIFKDITFAQTDI